MNDNYFESEEFLELLSQYEQAQQAGMPAFLDVDDLADVADYYQMQGRYDDALAAVDQALSQDPTATLPLVFKVRQAISEDRLDDAVDYLGRIADTTDIEFLYASAELLIAQDRIDEADTLLRQKLHETPADELQDYVVDVANIYSDYGVHDKAMEWMMRAHHENNDDFKELMARTLFGVGKYKDSEKIFNELIDHDPYSKDYWNALASAQFMQEDYAAAVASSEYAIAIDPSNAEALLSKANGLFRLDNMEEALDYYCRYSQLVPDDEYGLLHQGTCLISLGRYEEALQQLDKALDIVAFDSPYIIDIYQEAAFACCEMGSYDKALAYLNDTDHLDCDHVDIEVVKGHVMLAADKLSRAERYFKHALETTDKPEKTLLKISVSFYDNKLIETAYAMFQRYLSIVPPDATEGFSYMALCCWDMKKPKEFMKHLKTAVERNPREAAVVLKPLFPEGLKPDEFLGYMEQQLK